VAGRWKREEEKKKEMLGSVRLNARCEGSALKHVGARSVHIYILPGYDGFLTWQPKQRGQACTAKEGQAANAGSHPMAKGCARHSEGRCDALIYLVGLGPAEYQLASLHQRDLGVRLDVLFVTCHTGHQK
jgi:hypothetical protein